MATWSSFPRRSRVLGTRAFWHPQTKLFGLTGDLWMTSAGIEIEAKRDDIAKFPFIVLSGKSNLEQIGIVPKYHAELVGQKPIELPVHVTVDETQYRVVIDATGLRDAGDPSLRIKLTADRWFVRKNWGIRRRSRRDFVDGGADQRNASCVGPQQFEISWRGQCPSTLILNSEKGRSTFEAVQGRFWIDERVFVAIKLLFVNVRPASYIVTPMKKRVPNRGIILKP